MVRRRRFCRPPVVRAPSSSLWDLVSSQFVSVVTSAGPAAAVRFQAYLCLPDDARYLKNANDGRANIEEGRLGEEGAWRTRASILVHSNTSPLWKLFLVPAAAEGIGPLSQSLRSAR